MRFTSLQNKLSIKQFTMRKLPVINRHPPELQVSSDGIPAKPTWSCSLLFPAYQRPFTYYTALGWAGMQAGMGMTVVLSQNSARALPSTPLHHFAKLAIKYRSLVFLIAGVYA